MKSYMYILQCSDGSYYTGSTRNLEHRLWQHQNGLGANYTRKNLPVQLVYSEEFDRIDDAFYREKQVQGWSRRKKEALIKGQHEKLPELAASTSPRVIEHIETPVTELVETPVTALVEVSTATMLRQATFS